MGNKQSATSPVVPKLCTKLASSAKKEHDIVKISIYSTDDDNRFKCNFVMYALYSKQEKLGNILSQIEQQMNETYKPIKLKVYQVSDGFTGEIVDGELDSMRNKSITEYQKHECWSLSVEVRIEYQHKVKDVFVSCEYMKQKNTNDPLQCPVYHAMKQKYEFSTQNLSHLNDYHHFHNEFEEKPQCKYGQDCKAYIRLENGQNTLDDSCHMKIYRHPPRTRNIKLAENIHSLVINKKTDENYVVYWPTKEDDQKYGYDDKNGYLKALIEEVINNGYKSDLCLECGQSDECKHDDYSILQIVDDTLQHNRHKAMGSPLRRDHMLSLILYTGCDCNYDLCAEQRKGNYAKWKWFDYCLYNGIKELSLRERGCFSVYSGLNNVKLDKKEVESGHFVTYVSSSWRKDVENNKEEMDNPYPATFRVKKNHRQYAVLCCTNFMCCFGRNAMDLALETECDEINGSWVGFDEGSYENISNEEYECLNGDEAWFKVKEIEIYQCEYSFSDQLYLSFVHLYTYYLYVITICFKLNSLFAVYMVFLFQIDLSSVIDTIGYVWCAMAICVALFFSNFYFLQYIFLFIFCIFLFI